MKSGSVLSRLILIIGGLIVVTVLLIICVPSQLEANALHKLGITLKRMDSIASRLDSLPPPKWPNTLQTLEFPENNIDSFTGKHFKYIILIHNNEAHWMLISTGPDKKFDFPDNLSQEGHEPEINTPYDPTNGVHSQGDITMSDQITPDLYNHHDPKRHGNWRSDYYGYKISNNIEVKNMSNK